MSACLAKPDRRIRIGCSGWMYRHWRGAFYPEKLAVKHWFQYYAEHFDTVEINNSFYRLPSPEIFAGWRDKAPEGFRYAVKANRYITQAKKLKDGAEPVARMMGAADKLGETLGPVLYQLPPTLKLNMERLEQFLHLLPKNVANVFEFRDPSWLTEDVLALLDRHGASFCAHDMPGLATQRWAAGPVAYVRFHGTDGKYHGRYNDEPLLGWSDWIVAQRNAGRSVWAYFNNDIEAHAIADALTLKAMVAQATSTSSR